MRNGSSTDRSWHDRIAGSIVSLKLPSDQPAQRPKCSNTYQQNRAIFLPLGQNELSSSNRWQNDHLLIAPIEACA